MPRRARLTRARRAAKLSRAPHLEPVLFEFLQSGGPLMIPIGLCSVVGLAAFLERLWALRQGRVLPRSLRVAVMDLVRQGRFEDALIACRQSESPWGRVAEVVLRGRGRVRAEVKELAEEVGPTTKAFSRSTPASASPRNRAPERSASP